MPWAWTLHVKQCLHHPSTPAMICSTPCPKLFLSCSCCGAREPALPCLTSHWLPWKGQVWVSPTCPTTVQMPPQWKYWGNKGLKKDKCKMLLFTPAIVFLYSQTILTFTPSSVSTSDDLFQWHLGFFCGRSDLNYCCTPYCQQLPHIPTLDGGYCSNSEGCLLPLLLTGLAGLPFFHLLCPRD